MYGVLEEESLAGAYNVELLTWEFLPWSFVEMYFGPIEEIPRID